MGPTWGEKGVHAPFDCSGKFSTVRLLFYFEMMICFVESWPFDCEQRVVLKMVREGKSGPTTQRTKGTKAVFLFVISWSN